MRAYRHLNFFKTLNRVEGTLNRRAGLMAGMEKNPGQARTEPMLSKEIGAETKSILQRTEAKIKAGEQKCESLQRYGDTERMKQ